MITSISVRVCLWECPCVYVCLSNIKTYVLYTYNIYKYNIYMYYIYYGQCFIYDAKNIDAEALPSIIIELKLWKIQGR